MERLTDKRIESIYEQLRGDGFDAAADVIEQLQGDLSEARMQSLSDAGQAADALDRAVKAESDNAALRADVERLRDALAEADTMRAAADAVSEWFCTEARHLEGHRINALRMAMVKYDEVRAALGAS